MAYLKSSQVKVFPSAFRGNNINPESFLTTEANIKEPVLSTYHKTYAYKDDSGNYVLCLKGYRFYDISFANIITALGSISGVDSIWAGIRIADIASSYSGVSIPTLVANTDDGSGTNHILDNSDSEFTGLLFATTEEGLTNCTEKIKLFERVSSGSSEDNFKIPDAYSLLVTSRQVSNGNTKTPIAQEFTTGSISADTVTTKEITSGTQYGNYVICNSASSEQAKVVSLSNFKLVEGVHIFVKFTNTNTASNPTLNVNGTGAKQIKFSNSNVSIPSNNTIISSDMVGEFVYDGTYWILLGNKSIGSLRIQLGQVTPTVYDGSTDVGVNLWVPASSGNSGQVLVSSGTLGLPQWTNQASLSVGVATKIGSSTVGTSSEPIYISAGVPTKCTSYYVKAGKIVSSTEVNGVNKGDTDVPVYFKDGKPEQCLMTFWNTVSLYTYGSNKKSIMRISNSIPVGKNVTDYPYSDTKWKSLDAVFDSTDNVTLDIMATTFGDICDIDFKINWVYAQSDVTHQFFGSSQTIWFGVSMLHLIAISLNKEEYRYTRDSGWDAVVTGSMGGCALGEDMDNTGVVTFYDTDTGMVYFGFRRQHQTGTPWADPSGISVHIRTFVEKDV